MKIYVDYYIQNTEKCRKYRVAMLCPRCTKFISYRASHTFCASCDYIHHNNMGVDEGLGE